MSENGASGQEPAITERLTPEQERLVQRIRSRRSLPMEEVSDQIDDVRSLVRAGRVLIEIRQFVWGLEFALALSTTTVEPQVGRVAISSEVVQR